jgi:quaternary ammonium compound-resistance protein SugE
MPAETSAWLWLLGAGAMEIVWVIFLKASDGFTRLAPSAAVVASLAFSFFFMSQSLKVLPMGTVYAVWTGIGAAGGIAWGIVVLGEPAGAARLLCLALILGGVAGLKLLS